MEMSRNAKGKKVGILFYCGEAWKFRNAEASRGMLSRKLRTNTYGSAAKSRVEA